MTKKIQQQLNQGVMEILNQVIKPKPNERVLVLGSTTGNSQIVARAFYDGFRQFSQKTKLVLHPEKRIGEPAEKIVLEKLRSAPDIFVITNLYWDGRDEYGETAGYQLGERKIHWLPEYLKQSKKSRGFVFTVKSLGDFSRALLADYDEVKRLSLRLERELKAASFVRIKNDLGTDLLIDINDKSRKPKADYDGTQDQPGSGLNIPTGEVLISPVMRKTEGVAVIDLEFYDEERRETVKIDRAIRIIFRNGLIKSIFGGKAARRFKEIIACSEKQAKNLTEKRNCRSVSEFAIGINRKIGTKNNQPVGDLLLDEKIYGTGHIAFGSSYDNDPAPYHSDFIFSRPEIYLGDKHRNFKLICKNRQLYV